MEGIKATHPLGASLPRCEICPPRIRGALPSPTPAPCVQAGRAVGSVWDGSSVWVDGHIQGRQRVRGQKAWTPRVNCDSMGLLLEGAFGHVPGVRGGGS